MNIQGYASVKRFTCWLCATLLSLIIILGTSAGVKADESDARRILKAMSDFMAAQPSISFDFDAILEVVTTEEQKLSLASSGSLVLSRPDKIRVTRTGGFADIETFFDGKILTLLGKNLNLYSQIDLPGTLDNLVNELHETYNRPLPAADLLLSSPYEDLMAGVIDIKDLGSGVIGGVECDHLAFRTDEVDWQIWIGQGDQPYPYRYVITSKGLSGSPDYAIQTRNWKRGSAVAAEFSFTNSSKAKLVDVKELMDSGDLPDNFTKGETK